MLPTQRTARCILFAAALVSMPALQARAEDPAPPLLLAPAPEPSAWPAAPPPAAGETPSSPEPGGWYVDLAIPTGYLAGDTAYRISAYDLLGNGLESELRFPIRTPVIGVRAGLGMRRGDEREGFAVELTFLRSLGEGSGKILDSDWQTNQLDIQEVGVAHPGKDIYSESASALTATIVEGRLAWRMHPVQRFELAPLAGFLYQDFSYRVSDTNQVGYGPYAPVATAFISGLTATYDVSYQALYLGVRGETLLGERLRTGIDVWFSPLTHAEDRDDHLLREMLNTASANGTAWQAAGSARLALSAVDTLEAMVSYLRIDTTGTQHQSFYGGPNQGQSANIHDRIKSSRTSAFLTYRHRL